MASKRPNDSSGELDFFAIYYGLRERIWIVIACLLLGIAGAAGYLAWAPKVYMAQAIIQVDQGQRKVVKIEDINSENLASMELLKTLEQNLGNWNLLERVLKNPRLKATPEALGLKPRPDRPYTDGELLESLAKGVGVQLIRGTRLLSVNAESVNPDIAGAVPELLIEEYQKGIFESHSQINKEANAFLLAEVDRLKAKLQQSKQALQDYKEKTGAVSLEDSKNITDARLHELNVKVTEAKSLRLKLEADYAQVKALSSKSPDVMLNITSVATAPGVAEQRSAVSAQEAEIARLSQRYKSKHPLYIQAEGRLEELKAGRDRAIAAAAQGMVTMLEAARATEGKFEEALRTQEQKSLELGRLGIEYDALAREVQSDIVLYDSLVARLKETDVTKGIDPEIIRIVQHAARPLAPSKPRKKLSLAAGVIGGLACGFLLALIRAALDRSLKTVDQAESFLGLPALGSVPRGASGNHREEKLSMHAEPNGAVAESFRTLRTAFTLLGGETPRKSVLFTSAVQGEGKSFTASNYAVALAQQGLRTLLIDADLRLPALGKIFRGEKDRAGTSDFVAGQTSLADAARETKIPNLWIMTAGNRAPNPAELLAGTGFGKLIHEATTAYDRVVIDTAPVNAVSDTLLLVKSVDTVCLVIHATRTSRNGVQRACKKLREAAAPLVGFVLNRLPVAGGKDNHYHYASGAYGKGVYGAPAEAK